jgi:hypothetical protein
MIRLLAPAVAGDALADLPLAVVSLPDESGGVRWYCDRSGLVIDDYNHVTPPPGSR